MTTRPPLICMYCSRLISVDTRSREGISGRCHAFPRSIPPEILGGQNLHQESLDDDGGMLYLSREDRDILAAEREIPAWVMVREPAPASTPPINLQRQEQ